MADMLTIAVDALGGDYAPDVVLEGVEAALRADEQLKVILCGPEDLVVPFAQQHERCEARVATQAIAMDEHPARAVRAKKDSSIVVGCKAVSEGEAQGFFSAGSTGACLAAATLVIGRIRGIARPALCTILPAPGKLVLLTDVGANADCKPEYLLQFAQMASVYLSKCLGVANPRVALLNIGEESTKGSQFAQETYALLEEQLPNFAGNGEGRDLLTGQFDAFVTDGFTGNVALKTIEGTAKELFKSLKGAFTASLPNKLAAAVLRQDVMKIKDSISADTFGGAPLLGVKGACVIGHGSSSAIAICNGILTTADIARRQVSEIIAQTIAEKCESATMAQEEN